MDPPPDPAPQPIFGIGQQYHFTHDDDRRADNLFADHHVAEIGDWSSAVSPDAFMRK